MPAPLIVCLLDNAIELNRMLVLKKVTEGDYISKVKTLLTKYSANSIKLTSMYVTKTTTNNMTNQSLTGVTFL